MPTMAMATPAKTIYAQPTESSRVARSMDAGTDTLSMLLEDDPLNDNVAPLDPAMVAFRQNPSVVSIQGWH